MNAQEFINQTYGTAHDVDGAYGEQCWDYFAYFCQLMKYPVINCTQSGYVKDIWNLRNSNGILKNFTVVNTMQCGDWAIFGETSETPYSHVAMFVSDNGDGTGKFIGQNQNGTYPASYATMHYSSILGAFRPNAYKTVEKPATNTIKPKYGVGTWCTVTGLYTSSNSKSGFTPKSNLYFGKGDYYINQVYTDGRMNPYVITREKNGTVIGFADNAVIDNEPSKPSHGSASQPKKVLHEGGKAKIKSSAKTYATGQNIPSEYKNKAYTLMQKGNGRWLIKELFSWVRESDLEAM